MCVSCLPARLSTCKCLAGDPARRRQKRILCFSRSSAKTNRSRCRHASQVVAANAHVLKPFESTRRCHLHSTCYCRCLCCMQMSTVRFMCSRTCAIFRVRIRICVRVLVHASTAISREFVKLYSNACASWRVATQPATFAMQRSTWSCHVQLVHICL